MKAVELLMRLPAVVRSGYRPASRNNGRLLVRWSSYLLLIVSGVLAVLAIQYGLRRDWFMVINVGSMSVAWSWLSMAILRNESGRS